MKVKLHKNEIVKYKINLSANGAFISITEII